MPPSLGDKGDGVLKGLALPTETTAPKKLCEILSVVALKERWTTVQTRGPGFRNLGNTCYMNSAMQALVHTPPLAELARSDLGLRILDEIFIPALSAQQGDEVGDSAGAGSSGNEGGAAGDVGGSGGRRSDVSDAGEGGGGDDVDGAIDFGGVWDAYDLVVGQGGIYHGGGGDDDINFTGQGGCRGGGDKGVIIIDASDSGDECNGDPCGSRQTGGKVGDSRDDGGDKGGIIQVGDTDSCEDDGDHGGVESKGGCCSTGGDDSKGGADDKDGRGGRDGASDSDAVTLIEDSDGSDDGSGSGGGGGGGDGTIRTTAIRDSRHGNIGGHRSSNSSGSGGEGGRRGKDSGSDANGHGIDSKPPIVLALELLRQAFNTQATSLAPRELVKSLPKLSKQFVIGRQEDCHEFLLSLLVAMHEACIQRLGPEPPPELVRSTFVFRIFGGRWRNQTVCEAARYVNNTYDPFLDISLPIGTAKTVEEVLGVFTAAEALDDFKCPPHDEPSRAERRISVEEEPIVLSLHLKRFEWDEDGDPVKVHSKVAFGTWLNLRPFMSDTSGHRVLYELYAVIVHMGRGAMYGHYVCYLKAADGMWYLYDDSSVQPVKEAEVKAEPAYLLFYVRRQPGDPLAEAAAAAAAAATAAVRQARSSPLHGRADGEAATGGAGTGRKYGRQRVPFPSRTEDRVQAQALPPTRARLAPVPQHDAASIPARSLAQAALQAPVTSSVPIHAGAPASVPAPAHRTAAQGAAAKRRKEVEGCSGGSLVGEGSPAKRPRQAPRPAAPAPAPCGRAGAGSDAEGAHRAAAAASGPPLNPQGFLALMLANLRDGNHKRNGKLVRGTIQVPKVKLRPGRATAGQGDQVQPLQQQQQPHPESRGQLRLSSQSPEQPRHHLPPQPSQQQQQQQSLARRSRPLPPQQEAEEQGRPAHIGERCVGPGGRGAIQGPPDATLQQAKRGRQTHGSSGAAAAGCRAAEVVKALPADGLPAPAFSPPSGDVGIGNRAGARKAVVTPPRGRRGAQTVKRFRDIEEVTEPELRRSQSANGALPHAMRERGTPRRQSKGSAVASEAEVEGAPKPPHQRMERRLQRR